MKKEAGLMDVDKGRKGVPPGIAIVSRISRRLWSSSSSSSSSSSLGRIIAQKSKRHGQEKGGGGGGGEGKEEEEEEEEEKRGRAYRASVLLLTFVAYALFHASRKAPSVVKNVLSASDDDSAAEYGDWVRIDGGIGWTTTGGVRNDGGGGSTTTTGRVPWPLHMVYTTRRPDQSQSSESLSSPSSSPSSSLPSSASSSSSSSSGWAPFNGTSGASLLGEVDVAFLAAYSLSMFVAGHWGDRMDLRVFLSAGMLGSGLAACLFGLAYWWNIHWLPYFFGVQIAAGLVQATGWPAVVAVVGNWFGKSKRGLIMGVWNAHTSVGNICGTLMASSVLDYGWGWSFLVPGIAMITGAAIVYLFLVVDPRIVGLPSPHEPPPPLPPLVVDAAADDDDDDDVEKLNAAADRGSDRSDADHAADYGMKQPLLGQAADRTAPDHPHAGSLHGDAAHDTAVGFLQAWAIPRVAPFAFCLFFAKLVAYTFLYWLPYYIKHTEIAGVYLSSTAAGNLSTVFDVGGTFGGILAGYVSDRMGSRAIVAASFIYAALPALLLYRVFGSASFWVNGGLLLVAGVCVNGPYALITTAVSADLGTHSSLRGSAKALATVTAIIDGTGSIGAAVGPLLTGYLSDLYGWNSVFFMLMASAVLSGLLLTGLVLDEFKELARNSKLAANAKKVAAARVGDRLR